MRFLFVVPIAALLVACTSVPTPSPTESAIQINQSIAHNGVTVTINTLRFAPADPVALSDVDAGYAHLFDGFTGVAMLEVQIANATESTVDLYLQTFGSVIIAEEQIDLSPYQFFGNALPDTLIGGASADGDIWLPLTASQLKALQSGANVRIVFTDGTSITHEFDIGG